MALDGATQQAPDPASRHSFMVEIDRGTMPKQIRDFLFPVAVSLQPPSSFEFSMPGRHRNAIDELVGRNIQVLRLQRKMSQTELARGIGVTFQQVQKYEKGANRVGAGRLFNIATIFGVPVGALFDGTDDPTAGQPARTPASLLTDPHALRLVQAFSALESKGLRVSLVELAELLAASRSAKTPARPKRHPRAYPRDLAPSHSPQR
jgi:transcriptional regulator with XRE-family HTH domain